MKTRAFYEHTDQCAGVTCCSTAPYEPSLRSLSRPNDAFLRQRPWHMLTKNRCKCGNDGTTPVSMPKVADRCPHFGRPQRRQQSVVSCGKVPSKASVCCSDDTQMTTLHRVPEHPPASPGAAFPLCSVRERLFFIHDARV